MVWSSSSGHRDALSNLGSISPKPRCLPEGPSRVRSLPGGSPTASEELKEHRSPPRRATEFHAVKLNPKTGSILFAVIAAADGVRQLVAHYSGPRAQNSLTAVC